MILTVNICIPMQDRQKTLLLILKALYLIYNSISSMLVSFCAIDFGVLKFLLGCELSIKLKKKERKNSKLLKLLSANN